MATTATKNKAILAVHGPGSTHWVGDGFPVRNLFPSNGIGAQLDPFLMLDYIGPSYFAPAEESQGVGEHPHRGFETITIAYQGAVTHRDSAGNAGTIFPGDVQWMTAASGIVHEEKHEREFARNGGIFEGVQLWLNLPRASKMSPPGYQGITSEQIPSVSFGNGSYARIIAGELSGTHGPARTFTPVNLFDVNLKAGHRAEIALPEGHNAAVVLLKGDASLNRTTTLSGEARIAVLSPQGESVTIEARVDTTLLVLSGKPLHEPVASHGPFVMNTREELMQAIQDYQDGKMGQLH